MPQTSYILMILFTPFYISATRVIIQVAADPFSISQSVSKKKWPRFISEGDRKSLIQVGDIYDRL